MYDVPSRGDIAKVVVTGEVVNDDVAPTLVPREAEAEEEEVRLTRRRDSSAVHAGPRRSIERVGRVGPAVLRAASEVVRHVAGLGAARMLEQRSTVSR